MLEPPPLPLSMVWLDAVVVLVRADLEDADLVMEANVLVAFDESDVEVNLIVELPLLPEPML